MSVAALYDIHGNLAALEAVLEELRAEKVDRIVVGGDVVPGPMPRQCIDLLLGLDTPVQFIRGNGERAVIAAMNGVELDPMPEQALEAVKWVARELGQRYGQLLAKWPESVRLHVNGLGKVLFCHATPRNDAEVFTRLTPEEPLQPIFDVSDAATVVCGHTHMQFDRLVGGVRVLNAGSVGMPFGKPGACWLLLGTEIALRRTAYDLAEAAERIRHSPYPEAEQFAVHNVLHPPSEEEMLGLFERAGVSGSYLRTSN